MQTETIIILIVGLISLSMIRLIVTMVGREFGFDHSAAQAADRLTPRPAEVPALAAVASDRPQVVRGTGRNRHLFYLAPAEVEVAQAS